MSVTSILKHKGSQVVSVSPAASIAEVAALLSERKIGAVLVRDAGGSLLGILSERDIVRSLAGNGAATLGMAAEQLMTSVLTTVTPQTTEVEAMQLMTENRVRHLPVLQNGALVGMISIGDVVKARIMQQEQEVDSLKAYVAGAA
jgi:CBS domain-containing protein